MQKSFSLTRVTTEIIALERKKKIEIQIIRSMIEHIAW